MTLCRPEPSVGGWGAIHAARKAEREAVVTHSPLATDVLALIFAYAGRADVLRELNNMAPRRLEEIIAQLSEAGYNIDGGKS